MIMKLKLRSFILASVFELVLILWSVIIKADVGVVVVISVWFFIMMKLFSDLYRNIELIGFLISFFVFLIGGQVAITYMGYTDYGVVFPQWVENYANTVLVISLFSLILGYWLVKKATKDNIFYKVVDIKLKKESNEYRSLRTVSKYAYFFAMLSSTAMLLEKILFFRTSGDYYSMYSEYRSNLPYIIKTFDNFMPFSFYIYLSTRPTKKEAMLPMMIYLAYLAGSLLTGRRIFIVVGLMVIVTYFIISDKETDDQWITKKLIMMMCIAGPVFVAFLAVYGEIRVNSSDYSFSLIESIGKFIGSQGFTVNVIKYGRVDSAELGSGKYFSFYNTLRFLRTSPITRWAMPSYNFVYGEYTVENATNSNSFANAITYLNSPYTFLKGGGYGSCYIAELFQDFGYIGVIIGNVLFGMMFGVMSRFRNKGILSMAIILVILDCMFKVPRYNFDYIVSELSIVYNWVYIFLIFFIAKYVKIRI